MLNIFRIFIGDLKKISRNAIAWIVVLGLTVVPSLYAWFNIAASWDPYSNTDQLKVAVASVDKGRNNQGKSKTFNYCENTCRRKAV